MEIDREGLEVLDRRECLRLLGGARLGRIAVTSGALPVVMPVVGYAMDGESIVFETGRGTTLDFGTTGSVVAFEVDETDDFTESGWSVLVRGVAEVVLGPQPGSGPDPEPWAEGVRPVTIRVPVTSISGRRVLGH